MQSSKKSGIDHSLENNPRAQEGQEPACKVTPDIAAEAAVWVARLHGPDRSHRMERECLEWQARSAAHRLAFERCTDTWQDVAGVTLSTYAQATSPDKVAATEERAPLFGRRNWAVSLTALASLTAMGLGGALVLRPWRSGQTYSTDVGEQRTLVLQDGTRMTLNTATHVRVAYSSAHRAVTVESGEVLFEVAKDSTRPFVVQAANTEVVATGTAFVVQLPPTSHGATQDGAKYPNPTLAVTLVEGHVVVRNTTDSSTAAMPAAHFQPIAMQAGERVRLSLLDETAVLNKSPIPALVDHPPMAQVLAWRRGEAVFNDVSLIEAIAEMNRYSRTPIQIVGSAAIESLRVSGQYQTGDSAAFAHAVAALHGLTVTEHPDGLELAPK